MLKKIAVVLMEDVALFEFGVLSEVFGIDRTDDGVPAFDFKVCSTRPGEPMRTSSRSAVIAPYGLDELVETTGTGPSKLLPRLMELELLGHVRAAGGGRFTRCAAAARAPGTSD